MLIKSAGTEEARVVRPPFAVLPVIILIAALLGAACFGDDAPAPSSDGESGAEAVSAGPSGPADTSGQVGTGGGLAAESDSQNPLTDGANGPRGDNAGAAGPSTTTPPEPPAAEPESEANEPTVPPVEALIFVEPNQVAPGQVFVIAVDATNASAASVALDGQFISMNREGARFYTVLPVAVDTPVGPLNMIVAIADLDGNLTVQEIARVEILPVEFPVELVEIDLTLSRLLDPEVIAEDRAVRDSVQSERSPNRFWEGYFQLPTEGVITSEFGLQRSYNGADPTDYHTGLDFAGPLGTDVLAPNAGIVAWTGETERRGRGVIIDHGAGVFSSYWHLSNLTITPGTPVAPGTHIGRIGTTGLSTGPHLHWELTVYGVPVDPLPWLRELEVPNPLAVFDPGQAINNPGNTVSSP